MEVFLFKVALESDKKIYRNIEMLGSHTLDDLHEMIFRAFDRYDVHLYSFFLTRKTVTSLRLRSQYPEFVAPDMDTENPIFRQTEKYDASEVKINRLDLKEKDKFYYLFDYGDSWWHEITLLAIIDLPNTKGYPKISRKSGQSPDQYNYEDEAL